MANSYSMNKKLVGRAKATPAESAVIMSRLKIMYPQMFKAKTGLKGYAEQTGKPNFSGASGSDLKELQKRFGKKK